MTSPGRGMQPDAIVKATVTGLLAAAELRAGELVAERYRIVRLLGMGGMGVVYQARDIELDVDIALKLLRPELASRPDAFERFRQELLLARQVSSPHVVRIHDLVKHGAVWLISMDYVAGPSLERLLDNEGALAPDRAIRITRQLALGLAAAHHRGVVHRDLKPANVLINEHGDAAITDFGVARSAGNTGITGSGVIIGTPEYLSPEQARADPLDGRSDLYALGLILFEMLTGTLPFRGGTPAEMLAQRIVRDPPSADTLKPGLPSFAVRLCARLLELKPARRFQSAEDVVRAIDRRRVPGLGRGQRVAVRTAFAMLAAGALAAGALYWYDATLPALPNAPAVASTALDLAPLPFTTTSTRRQDADLAAGIGWHLADSLATAPGIRSADAMRVSRALTELGFDASTAQRHRQRVADALGAPLLLEGELRRETGGIVLALAIRDAEASQPRWSAETTAVPEAGLPDELRRLQQSLQTFLELEGTAPAWPDASGLEAISRYQRTPPAQEDTQALAKLARESRDPGLWWLLLESLDQAGRTADATTYARQAREALAGRTHPAAQRSLALAAILLGENAEAERMLASLADARTNDHPALLLLARARDELGKFDQAHSLLERIVRDDPRNLHAWYALGKTSIMAGDSKRAVDDYLVRAQVLANRLADRTMQAAVTHALGVGYQNLGQLPAAGKQFSEAANMRRELGDARGEAVSLRNLSTVLSAQGNFEAAQAALDQARALLAPLGDTRAVADLANDAGVLDEERGEYARALDAYRSALGMYRTLGDERQIAGSLLNVGFAYYQMGEFDNAQVYWQQAAAIFAQIDDKAGNVHAQQNIGLAAIARGDFAAARDSLERSLRKAEEFQMAEERGISLAALAELNRLEGFVDTAIRDADAASDDFRKRDDPRGTTEMALLRSAALCDVGDWPAALAALSGLSPDAIANGEQASLLAWRLGEIALGRGDAKAALAAADDAIARARNAHSYGTELSAHLLRARALAVMGESADAKRELAGVREGVTRHASVPLRLLQAETSLRVAPTDVAAVYRETRALLARLPAYGRSFVIHAHAAQALRTSGGVGADEAMHAALQAYARLRSRTPEPHHAALAQLARSLGLDTEATP